MPRRSDHEDRIAAGSGIHTTAAEAYERYLVPAIFAPWAAFLVDLAAPRLDEYVLDLACGTGAATRFVALKTRRVVGVDTDPAMLEIAQRQRSPEGCTIEWRCGDACRLTFEDRTFDLCLCLQGLQHFSERAAALAEIRRVLKPSGRLVAAVWAAISDMPGLFAVAQSLEARKLDATPFMRPCALGNGAELGALVRSARFSNVEVQTYEKPAFFASVEAFLQALSAGSSASRQAFAQIPGGEWSGFVDEVDRRLSTFVSSDGLVFPYRSHVVVATP